MYLFNSHILGLYFHFKQFQVILFCFTMNNHILNK